MAEHVVQGPETSTRRLRNWVIGFTLVAGVSVGATSLPAERPATRLPSLHEQPLTQYRAYRRMHARSEHFGQEAWLEAWTEMDGGEFRYNIVSESGSDYIRTKVLKAVLKREQELIADGDCQRSELTPENYDFEEAVQGDGERYVAIKPKRKDVLLVDGRMVLSADGRELLRVEGRLSRIHRSGPAWSTSFATMPASMASAFRLPPSPPPR